MQTIFNISKFWRLAAGLLSLGVGQRLFLTGVVSPWTEDMSISVVLFVISFVCLGLGLVLIIPIGLTYYKQYHSDRRLLKSLGTYFLATVLLGLMIGIVGQLLYDYTNLSYTEIKTGMWAITSFSHNILKVTLCFALVSIFKKLPMRSRKQLLVLPIVGSCILTILSIAFSLWLPELASVLLSIVDILIIIATLYYFIYHNEEIIYEKTS